DHDVIATFPDHVVYQCGSELYRVDYTVNGDEVQITSSPVEVAATFDDVPGDEQDNQEAWSDAARQAALEARRARRKGKQINKFVNTGRTGRGKYGEDVARLFLQKLGAVSQHLNATEAISEIDGAVLAEMWSDAAREASIAARQKYAH